MKEKSDQSKLLEKENRWEKWAEPQWAVGSIKLSNICIIGVMRGGERKRNVPKKDLEKMMVKFF